MEHENKEYLKYLDEKAPGSPTLKNIVWAFCVGGLICVIGQAFSDLYSKVCGLGEEDAKTAVSVTMIFLGALFTGLNIYPKIAKYA